MKYQMVWLLLLGETLMFLGIQIGSDPGSFARQAGFVAVLVHAVLLLIVATVQWRSDD